MFHHRRLLATLLITMLLTGAWLAAKEAKRTAADVLGGDTVVKALQSATVVKVYRLKDQSIQRSLDQYVATAGPIEVDPALAAELAKVLTRYDSYEREIAVGCEPQFGVRTTFIAGKTEIDVMYCFACDTLLVYRNGEKLSDAYFAPAHQELVALAKRLLPKDETIRALK